MALTYNTNIFTQVNKWDRNNQSTGVFVSGKLNQYNKQGYPILDAIDIDWDGAFIKSLNSYLYSTEDLINCLDLTYGNFSNYTSNAYFGYVINNINKDISYLNKSFNESNQITYNLLQDIMNYLDNIDESIDLINSMTLDNFNFYGVPYTTIVDTENNSIKYKNRKYYLFDSLASEYYEVSEYYVLNHPNENYFMGAIPNLLKDMDDLSILNDFIGYIEYDQYNNTYTYTGLLDKLHKYDENINNIYEELEYANQKINDSYSLAYTSYNYASGFKIQIDKNTASIGYHTSYNIYLPLNNLTQEELDDYLRQNDNKIYYDDNGEYKITSYNKYYDGQYYVHYNKITGVGIEREIELLDDKIYDNSYILYKLNTKSYNPEYIGLNIKPDNIQSQERTIETSLVLSNINSNNGEITKGLITNSSLTNSFSYVFNWIILNKE